MIRSERDEIPPDLQPIYDAAYTQAAKGPPFYGEDLAPTANPTKEQVLEQLARLAGLLEGMNDWALRNGVRTSMLGHGPSGNA